jgi:hypothetical protein
VEPAGEPFGNFYCWQRGDPLPLVEPPAGLKIERAADASPLPRVLDFDPSEVEELRRDGHRLYVGRIQNRIVGHGWVATRTASIGELGVEMRLAVDERYLWGFVTIPDWRGRNVYPALLQAILSQEDADRFWIGHDVGNTASASGILKAGFVPVGTAYLGRDGVLRYARAGDDERARAAQALLGMPGVGE